MASGKPKSTTLSGTGSEFPKARSDQPDRNSAARPAAPPGARAGPHFRAPARTRLGFGLPQGPADTEKMSTPPAKAEPAPPLPAVEKIVPAQQAPTPAPQLASESELRPEFEGREAPRTRLRFLVTALTASTAMMLTAGIALAYVLLTQGDDEHSVPAAQPKHAVAANRPDPQRNSTRTETEALALPAPPPTAVTDESPTAPEQPKPASETAATSASVKKTPEVVKPAPKPRRRLAHRKRRRRKRRRWRRRSVSIQRPKGFVSIVSDPPAWVILDKKWLGRKTPIPASAPLKLTPGKHVITLLPAACRDSYPD